jgi:hypothetical protein
LDIPNTGEKKMFTCQNPSCRKTFTSPLKTLNLQQNPQYPYSSCPYCLTKLELIETPPKTIENSKKTSLLGVQPKSTHSDLGIKHVKNDEKPAGCQYHLGFLSERNSKQQIPEDCLVCKDSVECMLMKMRE